MNDIICPECGKPNLPEATICWNCQTALEIDSAESGDEEAKMTGSQGTESPQMDAEDIPTIKADIPEWLKRVRERVQEDTPEEDQKDKWEQVVLFEGDSEENKPGGKKKIKTRKPASVKKPVRKPEKKSSKEKLQKDLPTGIPLEEQPDDGSGNPDEDLPEGFIRLKD